MLKAKPFCAKYTYISKININNKGKGLKNWKQTNDSSSIFQFRALHFGLQRIDTIKVQV